MFIYSLRIKTIGHVIKYYYNLFCYCIISGIHLWRLSYVWNLILAHIWDAFSYLFKTGCDMRLSALYSSHVPLWMLASSGMRKLVFLIPILHSTYIWVRLVLLLVGSSLCIYTRCRSLLRESRHSQTTVVISSVDVVFRQRDTFVCLISHGLLEVGRKWW
jgi:hypothetical protein